MPKERAKKPHRGDELDPVSRRWLKEIGEDLQHRRDATDEKQHVFADRLGISRATMSAIENGSRSYGIVPLLRALAGVTKDPVKDLMSRKFKTGNKEHDELHRRLQELLDADYKWALSAQVNVDAVYSFYVSETKKKV